MLGLSDLELAQQLQQEEYQQQQAAQPVRTQAPSPQVSLPRPSLSRQRVLTGLGFGVRPVSVRGTDWLGMECRWSLYRSLESFLS